MAEEAKEHWEELKGLATEYVESRIDLVKIEASEKIARVFGAMFTLIILIVVLAFVLIAVSIVAGAYLNNVLESVYGGYLIVAGVYLLSFGLLIVQRKKVQEFFMNQIIKTMYENNG
ncbi:MAG: phage holin family protein [Bacteroidota bacterium]